MAYARQCDRQSVLRSTASPTEPIHTERTTPLYKRVPFLCPVIRGRGSGRDRPPRVTHSIAGRTELLDTLTTASLHEIIPVWAT